MERLNESALSSQGEGRLVANPSETSVKKPSGLPLALGTFFGPLLPNGYYLAAMSMASVAVPGIMIAVTLAACIGGWPRSWVLLVGIFGGLLGWVVLALVVQHFATIDRANPAVYHELRSRFEILKMQMDKIPEPSRYPTQNSDIDLRLSFARAEIKTYLDQVEQALGDGK
jgi:hypothetical protein